MKKKKPSKIEKTLLTIDNLWFVTKKDQAFRDSLKNEIFNQIFNPKYYIEETRKSYRELKHQIGLLVLKYIIYQSYKNDQPKKNLYKTTSPNNMAKG